jgi:hypothetical protein
MEELHELEELRKLIEEIKVKKTEVTTQKKLLEKTYIQLMNEFESEGIDPTNVSEEVKKLRNKINELMSQVNIPGELK